MRDKSRFALLLALVSPGAVAEDRLQPHESILAAITMLIESDFRQRNLEFKVEPITLDNRLKLPLCERPLEAFFPSGRRAAGFLSVGVRCTGGHPWTVYNKVHVKAYREVVVLKNAVRKGAMLAEADLDLEKRDLADLRGDYFTSFDRVINRAVKRSLAAGAVLSPEWLSVPKTIRRGQKVIIQVESSHFAVKMSGQALSDGEVGQRIRVRNDQSAKIVEGTVAGPGLVLIGL